MTASIIDGKDIARKVRMEIREQVSRWKEKDQQVPGLAVLLVGEDPASATYVKNKEKACQEVGIYSEIHRYASTISEAALLDKVRRLNDQPNIHGILVQLPLPSHIREERVIETISPLKDVDGFHLINTGRLVIGREGMVPCTPLGIMELLKRYQLKVAGRHAVVIGRSNIVGKPMSLPLLHEHATVTICHSRTSHLQDITRQADILVAAIGKARYITGEAIKPGAIVIDVGMNRDADGRLVGDVDFAAAQEVAGHITPVPGGVGPMTIAMLLKNTCTCAMNIRRVEGASSI